MASAEIVEQLERASIHSSDIREVQDDKPTSELRSRKKRKITVSVKDFNTVTYVNTHLIHIP